MTAATHETKRLRFPLFQVLLPIKPSQIPTELIAGITLAALAIPEVMGYTKISELLFLTGPLAYMPEAVLAAVVFLIGLDLINAVAIDDVDYSAAATLRSVHGVLKDKGIRLVFVLVGDEARAELDRLGITELVGKHAFYTSADQLLAAYRQREQ